MSMTLCVNLSSNNNTRTLCLLLRMLKLYCGDENPASFASAFTAAAAAEEEEGWWLSISRSITTVSELGGK